MNLFQPSCRELLTRHFQNAFSGVMKHKRDWAHLVKPITRHACWDNSPLQDSLAHVLTLPTGTMASHVVIDDTWCHLPPSLANLLPLQRTKWLSTFLRHRILLNSVARNYHNMRDCWVGKCSNPLVNPMFAAQTPLWSPHSPMPWEQGACCPPVVHYRPFGIGGS